MPLNSIKSEIRTHADKQRAHLMQRFFKTGKGEYGHGDVFLGLSVPQQRKIAKRHYDMPLSQIVKLLRGKIHEERFTALVLMVSKYQKAGHDEQDAIAKTYLANAKWINNWDLVDTSAPQIIGHWSHERAYADKLYALAKSKDLWERRIAVLATFHFIRQNDYKPTLKICTLLLNDKHDLMHKACGWMLREVGKRSKPNLIAFLDRHATRMPRTMLRYAIEKLPEPARQAYLAAK